MTDRADAEHGHPEATDDPVSHAASLPEAVAGQAATMTAVTMKQGIDYSFDRPSPQAVRRAGYSFVVRYLAPEAAARP